MGNQRYTEVRLTPVHLSGVVVPWTRKLSDGTVSDYKLVSFSGLEYFFVADAKWIDVLSWYSWKEVKVIGLLDAANLTLIPQKVFPKGPTGDQEKIIDLLEWKSRDKLKKVVQNINDLVVLPAALWAVLAPG